MKILSFDLETDPFKKARIPKPFLSGFYDGIDFMMCWDEKDCVKGFLSLLCQYADTYGDLLVYAHNGGKFDFHYLLKSDLLNVRKTMVLNGRIASFEIETLKGVKIEFRDSFLIFPMALSAYEKDTIDYELFEADKRNEPETRAEIIEYFKGDLKYLYNLIHDFHNRFGNHLTVASAAMRQLQINGYQLERVRNENFDREMRDYYFGGRVQCFDFGSFYGDFQYIDINSAYPYAMLSAHPSGKSYCRHALIDENGELQPFEETDFIHVWCIGGGALPFREDDGSLSFPSDTKHRYYYCTGWELKAGIEAGVCKGFLEGTLIRFDVKQDMRQFIEKYYADKKKADEEGDKQGRLFTKLIMNSSYGKFALDCRKFKEHQLVDFNEFPKREKNESDEQYQAWDWVTDFDESLLSLWERPAPTDGFFNVATAASITGFVRAMLFKTIVNSESVLYCDTDSLICKRSSARLGKELGEWDVEAEFIEVHIAGKKLYAARGERQDPLGTPEKIASKGARLTFDEVKRIANGETVIWENEAPSFSIKRGTHFVEREIKRR